MCVLVGKKFFENNIEWLETIYRKLELHYTGFMLIEQQWLFGFCTNNDDEEYYVFSVEIIWNIYVIERLIYLHYFCIEYWRI